MRRTIILGTIPFILALANGCSGSDSSEPKTDANTYRFETDEFTVPASDERFICYAKTLDEDLEIDRFQYPSRPVVHHFLLARTTSPEPEGISECDVLFRPSWLPMFGAGAGDSDLELPADASYRFKKGDQIMVQLHLLNSSDKDVTDRAVVNMRKTSKTDAKTIGLYAFGSSAIKLPPQQTTDVTNTCAPKQDLDVFAMLPHMHYLGAKLVFETADSGGNFTEIFRREPWSFDQQRVDSQALLLKAGTQTRVTCTFDNTTDKEVTYGESSLTEMCFLVTFVKGREGINGCIDSSGF
jgi:hypothetical protein